MVKRAHYLCAVAVLAATMILLGGCGSAGAYPGLYGANYGYVGVPTGGRNNADENGPVVLGGADTAFIAELGQPVDEFGDRVDTDLPARLLEFVHYPYTFINGVIAVRDTDDADRPHQIMLVLLSAPPNQPWTEDDAQRYSTAFTPADAQVIGNAPVANTRGLAGKDTVYSSATLAAAFPASAFTDERGNLVVPGTFNIQCIYPSESQSNQILSCQLGLGTRQTFHI